MYSELLSFGKNMCSQWFMHQNDPQTHQEKKLRHLLLYTWQHSNFYREYLIQHGITEKDLSAITLTDLPYIDKQVIMEHFDEYVTDPSLKKHDLEHWMLFHPGAYDLYQGKYRVLHTSGTSSSQGVFVYDQSVWENNCYKLMFSVLKPSLDTLKLFLKGKLRVAFIGATGGHYTGVSYAKQLPRALCHVIDLSINMEHSELIATLNDFQPHYVVGYANALMILAQHALEGDLYIHPHGVVNSGEQLTEEIAKQVTNAFNMEPINLYIATEGAIGFSMGYNHPMELHEDLMITEVIDQYGQSTPAGQMGQIVLTNLNNLTMPLIRYRIDDQAIPEYSTNQIWCRRLTRLCGRNYAMVPIRTQDGKKDAIHPNLLVEFYHPDIKQFQFISNSYDTITIRYVASCDREEQVLSMFNEILSEKRAVGSTKVQCERMSFIPPDQNGKTKLVKIETPVESFFDASIALQSRVYS